MLNEMLKNALNDFYNDNECKNMYYHLYNDFYNVMLKQIEIENKNEKIKNIKICINNEFLNNNEKCNLLIENEIENIIEITLYFEKYNKKILFMIDAYSILNMYVTNKIIYDVMMQND